jgi:alpha-L-glutamate ligase-like protein
MEKMMTIAISPTKLKQMGILGINSRNVTYISRYNPRRLYSNVDNKLKTKKLAQRNGMSVPILLGVIEYLSQLRELEALLAPWDKFVIKPTRGSGGKGIWVIVGRSGAKYLKSNGAKVSQRDVHRHINNILGGLYSLGGKPDCAMIEDLVEYDAVFTDYTFTGAPDIRIIVFKGFPIMAMLRCSTAASDGRANLHQGAIGVGIDLMTGSSLNAVQYSCIIDRHPDTGKAFTDLRIPHWQTIMALAASCYEMTDLGYLGCDIVLDQQRGPMILELNARPGLAIQLANGAGLATRLQFVEQHAPPNMNVSERVSYVQKHFAAH